MASSKVGQLKPFMIEEKKEGPYNVISEVTANKWKGCMIANIRKEEKLVSLMSRTWEQKKSLNRGFTGTDAATNSNRVDAMLEYVSQYAPNALYRDITKRATSLDAVWTLVRNWAGLKTSGCKQQSYFKVKHSFSHSGDVSTTDFFFTLRNAKEDCLLLCQDNGGKISFHGNLPTEDEELSPTLESDIVMDWLEAIGGIKLVEHVFRIFSKELESETLADLRQQISDNLTNLMNESEQQADLNRAFITEGRNYSNKVNSQQRFFTSKQNLNPSSRRPNSKGSQYPKLTPIRPPCKYCSVVKPAAAASHTLQNCFELMNNNHSTRAAAVTDLPPHFNQCYLEPPEEETEDLENYEEVEEDHYCTDEANVNSCTTVPSNAVVKINRVNITESPILTCTSNSNRTVYLLLDTGATASIMTKRMADILNIPVYKTGHKAVQVDGESQLPVLGEVHTTFNRGALKLQFSGLVVNQLGVDILAGTNFHVENDVFSRMAKGTIHIGDNCTVQSAPPSMLTLDSMESKAKQRLVKIPSSTTLLPGDNLSLKAPRDLSPNSFVMVEPNLQQTPPFFSSSIIRLVGGEISVKNESKDPIILKKNCQALSVYPTKVIQKPDPLKQYVLNVPPPRPLSPNDILKEVSICGNLAKSEKQQLIDVITKHTAVFQPSLPGYNHAFGPVYASFKFASKARPLPSKIRSPTYGTHQDLLFNQKCQLLKQLGVLIDPIEHGIQPLMTHNSWVVKKPSAASKRWEDCTLKDTRLVVGLDPLNKFLADPPGKVTKTESIYAALANWEFMGELDFSDFYFQIKFRTQTDHDKQKLGYLCIRTAVGTMCFSSATMGLLGMDVFQDELTDKMFGDLVLSKNVVKLADNIYFGAHTQSEFVRVFSTILSRCDTADLKLKPSKLKLNVQEADILGLNWNRGRLAPSRHKLDPLAMCDPPQTVSGLRSWLGSIRFNEICLPGAKLASLSKVLDDQIPATRSGKDQISWTCDLLEPFKKIQDILKNPLSVVIPKYGDTTYLAVDACTSLPAGGSKLFIRRPGVDGFLPSFNFGCRLPATLKTWSPCEVEAFFLNRGLEKSEFYTKLTGNPGIILTDCQPVYQAKLKLDKGQFSSNKRLQSLLNNVSSKRYSIQLLSAKLPSSLLKLVDFGSRNPVECNLESCTICNQEQAEVLQVSFSDADLSLASVAAWKELQHSCPNLRKTHALLISGRKLSKQDNKLKDVRSYLNKCTLNKQGLIVHLKQVPLQPKPNELIVVPRPFSFTFAKALHVKLNHPNPSQMKKQWSRKYFMLDEVSILQKVFDSCETPCQASRILPKELFNYSTQTKPDMIGKYFNADVLEESGQKILVVRENLTSFTDTMIIQNQTKATLKEALIIVLSRLKLSNIALVRVDGQSSLSSLRSDKSLDPLGIKLEIGLPKNINKNAVVDKAIRELREQILKLSPKGGPVSPAILARATASLNLLIRQSGRSAKELWLSRDQESGMNLEVKDEDLSNSQFQSRQASHASSASYSSRNGKPVSIPTLAVGDLVFVKTDRSKSKARDSFVILELDDERQLAKLQKFPMTRFRSHPIQVQYQNLYHCSSTQAQFNPPVPNSSIDQLPYHRPEEIKRPFITTSPTYTPDSDSESDTSEDHENDNEEPEINVIWEDSSQASDNSTATEDTLTSPRVISSSKSTSSSPQTRKQLFLHQPLLGESDYLKPGDTVLLVQDDEWRKVVLISHTGIKNQRNDSLYWNRKALDGSNPTGGYLFPGQAWGVLRNEWKDADLSEVDIHFPESLCESRKDI